MTKKTIFLLFVCFFSILWHNILAVPAVPWPVEKTQPDGSKITVYLKGDEKVNWMESLDGYTLMYDAQKYIVYAEQDTDKNMVPSKNKLSAVSIAPHGVKKGIFYSPAQVKILKQIWEITDDPAPQRAGVTVGSRKALCVLMGFSDKAFEKPKSELETLFNQLDLYPGNNSSKGSVRDFFRENSYGQLDLTVTLAGPYTAPNTREYYATREREFAKLAAEAADVDIDYRDFAAGSNLETFHILFAGYGDESIGNGKQIWSHKWQLSSPLTLDGIRVSVYSCSPELRGNSGNNTTYIGVICHELSHVFGSPDYYDIDGNDSGGNYTGSGNWDLMANGSWNDNGRQPAHINMFQKILYGWVTPVELITYTTITGMQPSAQQPEAYTIKANANGELYVLENRQQVDFDASLPGHGLLIWHVHQNALSGNGNNKGHPQQMYPVVASSSYAIPAGTVVSYGSINSGGTPFPGTGNKTAFTATTTPSMFTWAGLEPIAKPLTAITESGKNISFRFLDGPAVPVTNLQGNEIDGNVTLTWTAPDHAEVLGYKIYRDGALQFTINNKTTTTYTQIGVANGTYVYGVSAFYEVSESAPVTTSLTVSSGSSTYRLPVSNLQGKITLDKASLNWTAPFNSGWMTIAGSINTAYRFNETFTFFAGTSWEPDHLKGLDGYELTQIQFYLYETTSGVSYKVQIYEVDNMGNPVKVREQAYTGTMTAGMKNVTVSPSLTIDSSKEYRIGVEIHTVGGYCFAVDSDPIVPGRNWICEEDDWFLMEDAGFENNFITSVYLSSGNPSPSSPNIIMLDSRSLKIAPALTKYIIYRDGEAIDQTTATSYEDNGLTVGESYAYCVSAVYSDGKASESVCTELVSVNPFKPVENFYAELTGNEVGLSWEAPYAGGTVTYVTGTAAPIVASGLTAATITAAIRFEPNDLEYMDDCNITKVCFHPGNITGYTYVLQIWSGGTGAIPEMLVYEQPVTITNNTWNDITLTSPVPVNINEDLWIAVKITRTAGSGSFNIPCYQYGITGRSNLYTNGTTWGTISFGVDAPVTWPISAIIEPVSELTGFKILRNDEDIATLPDNVLSYDDFLSVDGDYFYCIKAQYAGGYESDAKCADVIPFIATAIDPVSVSGLKVYPNPVKSGHELYVTSETPNTIIQIFTISGVLVKQQRTTGLLTKINMTLPAGIYILNVDGKKAKINVWNSGLNF